MAERTAWIAVADRLPPPDTWMLVWTGEYPWIALWSSTHGIWTGVYENAYWRIPTHWQPLPDPPP